MVLIPGHSPLASFLHHPGVTVVVSSGQVHRWGEAGLHKLGTLITRSGLITAAQARDVLGNFSNFTYQFLQVQHFMRDLVQTVDVFHPLTAVEKLLEPGETKKLSRIYQILIDCVIK